MKLILQVFWMILMPCLSILKKTAYLSSNSQRRRKSFKKQNMEMVLHFPRLMQNFWKRVQKEATFSLKINRKVRYWIRNHSHYQYYNKMMTQFWIYLKNKTNLSLREKELNLILPLKLSISQVGWVQRWLNQSKSKTKDLVFLDLKHWSAELEIILILLNKHNNIYNI